jgi:hypothetical protein
VYHISLDLTQPQVKSLKQAALETDKSIKGFVTDLVVSHLDKRSGKPVAGGGSRGKKPVKEQKSY